MCLDTDHICRHQRRTHRCSHAEEANFTFRLKTLRIIPIFSNLKRVPLYLRSEDEKERDNTSSLVIK